MKKFRLLAIVLALLPVSFGATPLGALGVSQTVIHPHNNLLRHGASTNWSGYAVETNLAAPASNAVTQAAGTWTVPAITCTATSAYSSVWVGIDGYSDNTVQQTGTEQDCRNGRPAYYAWYETYPQPSYKIGMTIHPGDVMNAAVSFASRNHYTLTIADITTNRQYSTTRTVFNTQRQSAEWIVEAPSSFTGILPLADYGSATFTNISATINSLTSSISEPTWQNDAITMTQLTNPNPRSTPGPLLSGGTSFTTTWVHL